MKLLHEVAAFSEALDAERRAGRTVGLVPTMGALHDGHASLMRRAAAENDAVAVTIFVNPLQFAAGEDLDRYPRTLDADCVLAGEAGATYVLAPSVREMYGEGTETTVSVSGSMTQILEGASRPTHFDGVTTVVAKLFAMTGRCRAYFGEKDFQQLAVVRRMTLDLSLPVEIVPCPTVREPDGLAMSSRNRFLTDDERALAPALHRALQHGKALLEAGDAPDDAQRAMEAMIRDVAVFDLDYVAVVDPRTLRPAGAGETDFRLLVAARLRSGTARLIDNLGVTLRGTHREDA